MSSKEKLKCCKTPNILQYHEKNKKIHPENCYHHMVFMYYPFRRVEVLKGRNAPTYSEKFNELMLLQLGTKAGDWWSIFYKNWLILLSLVTLSKTKWFNLKWFLTNSQPDFKIDLHRRLKIWGIMIRS